MKKENNSLEIIYFNIEVLDKYVNNPIYILNDNGYRGQIITADEYVDKGHEFEYVKNFGFAYNDNREKAIGIFSYDLSNMPKKAKMYWKSKELENQDEWIINEDFVKNLICGKWTENYWMFYAIIDEMNFINEMLNEKGIPVLFSKMYMVYYNKKTGEQRKTWEQKELEEKSEYNEAPRKYRSILLPTAYNYYDFVLLLEKMIVNNINSKPFKIKNDFFESVNNKNTEKEIRGTINVFQKWLVINDGEIYVDDIIKPLREIRNIRQKPAHETYENDLNNIYYEKQDEIVKKTYDLLVSIRKFISLQLNVRKMPDYFNSAKAVCLY